MIDVVETPLAGAYLISAKPFEDTRGAFSRLFCRTTFQRYQLTDTFPQQNLSTCVLKGTIRGLHYQVPPASEVKLLHCIRGAVYDVIVDMREDSPTYLGWHGTTLSADDFSSVYIPEGFAHGYQALEDDSAVIYHASAEYSPAHERCVRFDDPTVGIVWPVADIIASDKDRSAPLLKQQRKTT